jgi:ABC-type lipoprotein release transport system permease subunit
MLGVLAGLAAGLAIATVAGAKRTESSYQRMRTQFDGADAVFFPSQVGIGDADLSKLSKMPEVAAWGGFATTESQFDEVPGGGPLIQIGDDWFTNIERAKVLEGRLPDPSRDDEAVINLPLVAQGAKVGGQLTFRNLSPADVAKFGGNSPPEGWDWHQATGPVTKITIVGIVRQPMESVLSFASEPELWLGPGWARAHLSEAAVDFQNAVVRLKHGAADLPAFEADVARVYGRNDIPVKDLSDDIKRVQRSLDVERAALLLFAAAVIVATVVLIGQAFGRSVRASSEGLPALSALGVDGRALTVGLLLPHIVTVVIGAAVAAAGALVLSSRFPIGLGRRLDPSPGFDVDWRVLTVGLVIMVVAATIVCGWVALRAVRTLGPRVRTSRTQLVRTATRAGASMPVALGVSMALEPAPSRGGSTARSALVAAAVGVLGVVGAVTLVRGIDDALHRPERTGQAWDLEASPTGDPAAYTTNLAEATTALAGSHDVEAFARIARAPSTVDQKGDVPLYALEDLGGSMHFSVLSGRAPSRDDEVALGPRTASAIGAAIGDTVTVGPSAQAMQVVGITLLAQTPHTSFDEGAWLTSTAFDRATGTTPETRPDDLLIALAKGASSDSLQQQLGGMGYYTTAPSAPPDVANLGNVRSLPLFLAAFLVALAIGAIAHALLTGARARSRELAVLRSLGLTPRQVAAAVMWQAAVIGVLALVVGIPLGLVLGRQVWRVLADSLSFVYVGPVAGIGVLFLVPIALGVVGAMAIWPASGAARLRTAEVLRSE